MTTSKPADLGMAGLVEERKIGDDKMIFVEKCKDPHSVAILIRAGLERMVDEAERAMTDSLSVVSDVIENNKIVPGGGAVEIEIAKELRKYATKVGGREQLAVEAFADAVEVIPRTLAENAGLNPSTSLLNYAKDTTQQTAKTWASTSSQANSKTASRTASSNQ